MFQDLSELAAIYFTHATFGTPFIAVLPVPSDEDASRKSPLNLGAKVPLLREANSGESVDLEIYISLKELEKANYAVTAAGAWEKKPDAPDFDLETWEAFVCGVALPQLLAVCKYEQVALTRSRKLMHARFSLEMERRFINDIRTQVRKDNA